MITSIRQSSVLLLVLVCSFIQAQTVSISGHIKDDNKHPVTDAIVQLLRSSDSALVKTEISDGNGRYVFSAVKQGEYLLQITAMSFGKYTSVNISANTDLVVPDISMSKNGIELKEVTVAARKPYIEKDKGKLILNVESSINAAGSSAMEIVEKAPGIRVDNLDNISLNGQPGTMVWIDGKPSPLTGADLANYLRGIPSQAIERIELITNPSARYDAAGSAIINIILKKDKRIGTNGSISLSYAQGVYPKSNNSISVNHRNKKVNVYGSYNYAHRQLFSHLQLQREFYQNDSFIGAFDQDNRFRHDINSHVARAGADFYLNKRNTLGIVFNGMNTIYFPTGRNTSEVYNNEGKAVSWFKTESNNGNHRGNYSANLNYKHEFDSAGTALVTDLDYAIYNSRSDQNITTRYYDLGFNETRNAYLLYGDLNGRLAIYALKNDFNRTLRNGISIEAGQKSSFVTADNDLGFYDLSSGSAVLDSGKSNHFIYTENINAAYVSASKDWKRWSLQLGLRAEHTLVTGEQVMYNSTFTRNYAQLFPNVVLTRKFSDDNSLELNYSRRIRRPGYEQLNPFKFYLDPTTYREGNPWLQPSITESFELTQMLKKQISLSVGFGRTYNNIIEVIAPLTSEQRVTVQTNVNLAKVDVYTFNGSVPFEITKWWNTSNNFNLYYASYNGNVANTTIRRIGNITANLNTVNSFNISKTLSAELSANYQAREVYAFDIIEPIWSVNAGMQLKMFNNKGTLRINLNDMFYTNKIRATVRYNDYFESFLVARDSRVATVAFTYKFGKNSVPGARRRQGGVEDIKQRAGEATG